MAWSHSTPVAWHHPLGIVPCQITQPWRKTSELPRPAVGRWRPPERSSMKPWTVFLQAGRVGDGEEFLSRLPGVSASCHDMSYVWMLVCFGMLFLYYSFHCPRLSIESSLGSCINVSCKFLEYLVTFCSITWTNIESLRNHTLPGFRWAAACPRGSGRDHVGMLGSPQKESHHEKQKNTCICRIWVYKVCTQYIYMCVCVCVLMHLWKYVSNIYTLHVHSIHILWLSQI